MKDHQREILEEIIGNYKETIFQKESIESFLQAELEKFCFARIDKNILREAIDKWGVQAQVEMIEEECLELALAIQRAKRNKGTAEEKLLAIIDEIADVRIIIEQALIIYADSDDRIQNTIEFKMDRLRQRLKDNQSL